MKMGEDVVSLWGKEEGKATCRPAETLVLNSIVSILASIEYYTNH
jgi:hypothetical protein